jgi:hypothetical protein
MYSARFWLLGVVASAFVWACSSAPPPSNSTDGAMTASSKNSSSKGDDDDDSTVPSKPIPAPNASATASPSGSATASPVSSGTPGPPTNDTCYAACAQEHPAGFKMANDLDAQLTACTCAATACGSQCGSSMLCSNDPKASVPSDACTECFFNGPAADNCLNQTDGCSANQDCAAAQKCMDACDRSGS